MTPLSVYGPAQATILTGIGHLPRRGRSSSILGVSSDHLRWSVFSFYGANSVSDKAKELRLHGEWARKLLPSWKRGKISNWGKAASRPIQVQKGVLPGWHQLASERASRVPPSGFACGIESTSYRSGYAEHTRGQQYGWFRPQTLPSRAMSICTLLGPTWTTTLALSLISKAPAFELIGRSP